MMKTLLAVALVVAVSYAKITTEEDVLVLTDDNFQEALDTHNTLLVEFYAPWCGHCKRLAPEYAKAAGVLKKDDLYIAKMDATANSETPSEFGVQGYPTLKFFRGGKASDYTGGRTETDIVNWVRKKSGPAAKTLTTVAEAEEFVADAPVAVIGIFSDTDGDKAKAYVAAANGNDDVPFAITSESDIGAKYGVDGDGIVLLKDFDEGKSVFEGEFDDAAILEWVGGNSLPLVIPFSQENAPKIFGGPIKVHLLMFADMEDDESEKLVDALRTVAKTVKGKMLAVTVGLDADRVIEYFGISEDDMPTAVIVNMPDDGAMKKFLFTADEVNEKTLSAFAASYQAGELSPFLKSEEVPESQDEPVVVVVGKSFEDVAMDETKDVLLEFYAPWCGHCKSLAPIYDGLAEKFADVDSIVIAKMDATANEVDHPDVNVRGFPTLKFFPAGKNAGVIDYDGARDEDGFIEFLKENAAIPFTLDGEDFGSGHSEL